MKKGVIFLTVLFNIHPVLAQLNLGFNSPIEQEILNDYLGGRYNVVDIQFISENELTKEGLNTYKSELNEFVNILKEKKSKYKREDLFFEYLFYKTHRKFLKHYAEYSSPADVLKNGRYDCLSGTTFYALLLHELRIPYTVIETNYHMYLLIQTTKGNYLYESTDALYGYTKDTDEIESKLNTYQSANARKASEKGEYVFDMNLNKKLGLMELAGLHYYNQAVNQFNHGLLAEATSSIEKSYVFYQSPRTAEFTKILLQRIYGTEDNLLGTESKKTYLRRLGLLRKKCNELVVSMNY